MKTEFTTEEIHEQIAKTCYEVNKAYCAGLGDHSFTEDWREAPDWQQATIRNGVKFHIDNPDAGPEGSHNNWMAEKEKTGWTFGETKDPDKKTHPCMVPYGDLPTDQQTKDALFIAVIKSFY